MKQLQADWSNYVSLIENQSNDNPDPSEEDFHQNNLAGARMKEIEKRLTEGISNKAKPTIQEIKKAAHDVLEYLH